MELFKPSKKTLEIICEGDELASGYENYKRGSHRFNEENVTNFIKKLYCSISEFYKMNSPEKQSRLAKQKIFNVSGEAFKNCYHHGPKNKEVFFGLFLGNRGVCYGFNDGGDYFKNEKIKKQYENKIEITAFDKKTLKENFQCGINELLFPNSDIIEVDSKKGILYCVQFKENIIAPEGEKGDSYFFKKDGGKGY
ncbi:hypothetical protein HYS72_03320 [Candidatus Pacearchaeota archaeon]|nr:hypothetical protein [Candidatus Pacearchaeota archaeon]MBI2056886.1 hypothetical protein [Candidatus Pacearchaeota archaeon]